jgi:hypothetical protein
MLCLLANASIANEFCFIDKEKNQIIKQAVADN